MVWFGGMEFAYAQPAAPSLVSPSGNLTTNSPTYIWGAVAEATQYYFDAYHDEGVSVIVWLSPSDVGCGSGTGNCQYTPVSPFVENDEVIWWVASWNEAGLTWSNALNFVAGPEGEPEPEPLLMDENDFHFLMGLAGIVFGGMIWLAVMLGI